MFLFWAKRRSGAIHDLYDIFHLMGARPLQQRVAGVPLNSYAWEYCDDVGYLSMAGIHNLAATGNCDIGHWSDILCLNRQALRSVPSAVSGSCLSSLSAFAICNIILSQDRATFAFPSLHLTLLFL
jgi:hypothetical protein